MKRGLRIAAFVFGILVGSFYLLFSFDAWPIHFSLLNFLGFLTQAAPGLLLIIASFISLRNPRTGLIVFTVLAVAITLFFSTYRNLQYFLSLTLPIIVVALLLYSSLPSGKKNSGY
jgi:hypothetical protein